MGTWLGLSITKYLVSILLENNNKLLRITDDDTNGQSQHDPTSRSHMINNGETTHNKHNNSTTTKHGDKAGADDNYDSSSKISSKISKELCIVEKQRFRESFLQPVLAYLERFWHDGGFSDTTTRHDDPDPIRQLVTHIIQKQLHPHFPGEISTCTSFY